MNCKHLTGKKGHEVERLILSSEDPRCISCLVEKEGAMTQEKVSEYMKISKSKVGLIERHALQKIKNKITLFID